MWRRRRTRAKTVVIEIRPMRRTPCRAWTPRVAPTSEVWVGMCPAIYGERLLRPMNPLPRKAEGVIDSTGPDRLTTCASAAGAWGGPRRPPQPTPRRGAAPPPPPPPRAGGARPRAPASSKRGLGGLPQTEDESLPGPRAGGSCRKALTSPLNELYGLVCIADATKATWLVVCVERHDDEIGFVRIDRWVGGCDTAGGWRWATGSSARGGTGPRLGIPDHGLGGLDNALSGKIRFRRKCSKQGRCHADGVGTRG